MYLHLGDNVVVRTDKILGIFDIDNASREKATQKFLNRCQREGRITAVGDDIPKSFILLEDGGGYFVYLTQISPATILKRSGNIARAQL